MGDLRLARVLDGNGHDLGEVIQALDEAVDIYPGSRHNRQLRDGLRSAIVAAVAARNAR